MILLNMKISYLFYFLNYSYEILKAIKRYKAIVCHLSSLALQLIFHTKYTKQSSI